MNKLSKKSKAVFGTTVKLMGPAEYKGSRYFKLMVLASLLLIPLSATAQIQLPRKGDVGRVVQDLKRQNDAAQLSGRCEKLLKWSQQLEREYPDKDLYRIPMNELQVMAVPLFSDSAFIPYFGKPYDQFSPDERQKYWMETMSKCFTSSQHRSAFTWQRNLLVSSFQARPLPVPLAAEQLVPAIAALRQARSDLARMNAEIAALPATAENL